MSSNTASQETVDKKRKVTELLDLTGDDKAEDSRKSEGGDGMAAYNEMVTQVEDAKDKFTPEVYDMLCDALEALKVLCQKRDERNGRRCFMTEPVEALIMYILAIIKNPTKQPSLYVYGL